MEDQGLYGGDLYGGQRIPFAGAPRVANEPAASQTAESTPAHASSMVPDVDTMSPQAAANESHHDAAAGGYDPSTGVYCEPATARDQVGERPAEIVKERRPASDDDDQATAETVKMMCDYIAQGVTDRACNMWACLAIGRYGLGKTLPAVCAWSVFWMLKHHVRYIHDEGRLFMSGDGSARDRLLAPAVLVRMKSPAEDCDGFTMLACCLLRILKVPCYIVTLKADPTRPWRWSHVFAMAELPDGSMVPVDATPHGKFPGWMVPREHIFGYQIWDMDGRATRKSLPPIAQLHGYVRKGQGMGAGLGALVCTDPADIGTCYDNGGTPAAGSGFNWNTFLNNLVSTAGKVATVAEAPSGSVINPSTGQIITGGPGASAATFTATGASTNALPWLLGGGLVIALLAFSGGKRR